LDEGRGEGFTTRAVFNYQFSVLIGDPAPGLELITVN